MFKNKHIDQLVEAKIALNRAEEQYNKVKENFVNMYGPGEFVSEKAKVSVSSGIRNNIAWSKIVKEKLPNVKLDKYTTQTEFIMVNVTPLQ